jgi:trimeric autotransporter adhesin
MRLARVLFVVALVCAGNASARQQNATQTSVPRLVQFSGVLKDAALRPVSGVSSVTFAIYAEQEGGTALWSETQNVLADGNGHYSIVLGAATTGGFPVELFGTGQSRWLGIAVARQSEMPRVLLASVPYALKAGDAETLGGLPASSYVTTQQLAASNARPATTYIGGGSTIVATPGAAAAAAPDATAPVASTDAAPSSVIQANPTGSGTTNYIPVWTSGSNLGNSLLFETGGKLGVGITSPAATLDINGGEILRGGFYEYP